MARNFLSVPSYLSRQRQQLILINTVRRKFAMLARRGLGTTLKSSRVGELSLAMRLHGKKIALAPEFPYCSRREGNPGTRDKLSRVLVNMS